MIGTPNGGDILANNLESYANNVGFLANYIPNWYKFFCLPALHDLGIGADDTYAKENNNTNYYTIYGNWNPSLPESNCPAINSHRIDWLGQKAKL